MEMTVGTVTTGQSSPQPGTAASSSQTDFSEVLSGVRSQSGTKQPGTVDQPEQKPQGAADSSAQTKASDSGYSYAKEASAAYGQQEAQSVQETTVTASAETLRYEEISVELKETLVQFVASLSGGDDEKADRIIQMLLDYLKKMQNGDGDETTNLAMQLLMSMMGGQAAPSAQVYFSVQNVSAEVTAVSAEYAAMSVSVEQTVQPGDEVAQTEVGISPDGQQSEEQMLAQGQNEEQTANAQTFGQFAAQQQTPETAQAQEAVQPEAAAQTPVQQETQTAEAQPETVSQETAISMLNEILEKARKDLGLSKAELTQTQPVQQEQQETPEQPVQAVKPAGLELQPNHRDGRDELDTILENGGEKKSDEPETFSITEQGAQNAVQPETRTQEIAAPVNDELPRTNEIPPERQLADEILSRSETLSGGRTEFTMVLNPESLGRITVRLASTGGRVEVSISAENDSTRQLLASRTEQLSSALRDNGVDLERYQVVGGQEEAQLMQDNYDGSSRNPYGRQENDDAEETDENGNDFLEILQQI